MTKIVWGDGGWRGELFAAPDGAGSAGVPHVLIQPDDGGAPLLVPAELLVRQSDGTYYLPLARDAADTEPVREQAERQTVEAGERVVVPVIEEMLSVEKRVVETGRVRITKTVSETREVVDEPLLREEVSVERVPINRVVAQADAPHQDGDTLVVPLYEEILVDEKRLILREEVHITRRSTEAHEPQTVTLRREQVQVEREDFSTSDRSSDGESASSTSTNTAPAV